MVSESARYYQTHPAARLIWLEIEGLEAVADSE